MSRKAPDRLTDDVAGALPASPKQAVMEGMSDIPDFTPEEWEWLKEQTREYEKGYLPTRSLIPGL